MKFETVSEIQADRQRMAQEHRREMAFAQIFRTPVNGKVAVRNQACEQVIESWLDEIRGETLSSVWFIQVLKDNPKLANQLTWQNADVLDPKNIQQAAAAQVNEDRKTFSDFVRVNGFSENDANWSLTKSVLGSGFDSYQLTEAVASNALRLAPASEAELQRYAVEYRQARQDYLTNRASHAELKQAARTESEQRASAAAKAHVESQITAREQAEASGSFLPLPEFTKDGNKIDGVFLRNLEGPEFKKYCSRHGFAAVTARINGRK